MSNSLNCDEKPLLSDTGKGFSVFYKERFLYSKRQPSRAMDCLVESLAIQKKTLVLFVSPVLGYGLKEIIAKLPEDSFLMILEADGELGIFFENSFWNSFTEKIPDNVFYLCTSSVKDILKTAEEKTNYNFTKVLKIEASGGAGLYENFYNEAEAYLTEAASSFWKNRITLIAMGRNYSRNIFKNYSRFLFAAEKKNGAEKYKFISPATVNKPIFVAGAGPSLDESRSFLRKNRRDIFLLAVDAALPALMPDIIPDAAVLLESQFWIQKTFIGFTGSNIPIISDITANPQAVTAMKGGVFFFFTEYTKNIFINRFSEKNILPPSFLPMGSVGLTAVQLASFIAKKGVPIFCSGLDFSWKSGYTHAKGSPQVSSLLNSVQKMESLYNTDSVFPQGLEKGTDKNGGMCFTIPNLYGYCQGYKEAFGKAAHIFDLGKSGLKISCNTISENEAEKIIAKYKTTCYADEECCLKGTCLKAEKIKKVFNEEIANLSELKNILTGKDKFDSCKALNILNDCGYLYLHFPDALTADLLNTNFLKRVRIELEYFLKTISGTNL